MGQTQSLLCLSFYLKHASTSKVRVYKEVDRTISQAELYNLLIPFLMIL